MLDVRYHIFYLGLMFLMLGFGVFIGASVIGPAQVKQQTQSIAALRAETNKVVQDRDGARERLGQDEAALAALRPALVRGKLAGKRVVLIQTGDYAEATQDATTALGDAGAAVAGTVILTSRWDSLTPRQRASLPDPPGAGGDPAAQDAALLAALASALSQGAGADAADAATLAALQGQGLATLSGDLSKPCKLFVLVGGGSDDTQSSPPGGARDAALLSGFQAQPEGVTVAGCEPSFAASSSMPAFQAAGIATVDCIDLPLGQLDLPFTLRGAAGSYGVKPTAGQPLPATLGGPSTP